MSCRLTRPDRLAGYLILKGALSLFLGYAYAVAKVPHSTRNALSTVTAVVPVSFYGLLWIASGVYCVGAALTNHKTSGFTVAAFMPALWGLLFLICWLHGDPGRGWVSTGIFWAIAGAVLCTSGLIDPTPVIRRARR